MKLQTTIPLQKESRNLIDYQSKILLLGSCFSENIGNQLEYYKFQTHQNPFGIFFHPLAIENFIANAVNQKEYSSSDVFSFNERWHSFDAHSILSSDTQELLLQKLNSKISKTHNVLKETSHLVITFGTSWVYRFIEKDSIVANCHKIPQKNFLKELLSVEEITNSIKSTIALVKTINPKTTILFTVSPVRHLKDGFIENTLSKSNLISAIHNVVDKRANTHYFPSYEIMMDELRDYRFYAEDMIHPNKTAIKYIWDKFLDTWFHESVLETMKKVETIQKGKIHRPFNEKSESHKEFLRNLELKKDNLIQQFSFMKF